MRSFVKGICIAALVATFAVGAMGCGKSGTCEAAVDNMMKIEMKEREAGLKDLTGDEKKEAEERLKAKKEKMAEKKAEEIKECKEKKYSADCLSCIAGVADQKGMAACESKCKSAEDKK